MPLQTRPILDAIPTSSMADIAFLLIIYFMVTATFAATKGLDLAQPAEEEPPSLIDPVDSILVEVLADGSLRVDKQPLGLARLLSHLEPTLRANPVKPVIVRPAPDAAYGVMVDVLDELRQGRQRLGLADEIVIALPTEREVRLFWPS